MKWKLKSLCMLEKFIELELKERRSQYRGLSYAVRIAKHEFDKFTLADERHVGT